jgi:hypothetical protein
MLVNRNRFNRVVIISGLIIITMVALYLISPKPFNPISNQENLWAVNESHTSTPSPGPTEVTLMFDPDNNPLAPFAASLPPEEISNCTNSYFYWRDYPQTWLLENIQIGQISFTKTQVIAILHEENQDVVSLVLKQFFTSVLNVLKGADSRSIDAALTQSSVWLTRYAPGAELSQTASQEGLQIAQVLELFNSGHNGPGSCDFIQNAPTPTPIPSETPIPTSTVTLRPVQRIPSATPTNQNPTLMPTSVPPTSPPAHTVAPISTPDLTTTPSFTPPFTATIEPTPIPPSPTMTSMPLPEPTITLLIPTPTLFQETPPTSLPLATPTPSPTPLIELTLPPIIPTNPVLPPP